MRLHPRQRLETALSAAIDQACAQPMRWGHDDCALWVAGVLRQALGYDPAAKFRGRYRSRAGAHRVLGKGGLAGAFRAEGKKRGWRLIDPARAQVGDLGLASILYQGKPSIAGVICRAPGRFVGRNESGVTVIRSEHVRLAFKVAPHRRAKPTELGRRVAMPMIRTRPKFIETLAAAQEPVSTFIGLSALLFNTGLFASVGLASTVGGAIIGVGLAVGLNYAASALQQRGSQPLNSSTPAANDPSIRYNTRQPIPPKRIIYGTAQVGGALFFEANRNPYLYQGLMLCAKPITQIKKVWIGANELSFASLAPDMVLTPLAVAGQPSYATRLQASLRLGAADQDGDLILMRDFPGMNGAPLSNALGTAIGDMTDAGGLAAGFDGDTTQTAANGAQINGVTGNGVGHIGKDWGSGVTKVVIGFLCTAPTDDGFSNSTDSTVTMTLQGSTDNFSSSIVTLVTFGPGDVTNGGVAGASDPTIVADYRYHRVVITETNGTAGSHKIYCAECQFFEATTGDGYRQRGIATAVLRYHFGADQAEYTTLWGQTQRPNPIFLVDGIAVPDPRKSGHIVEYDPTDPAAVAAAEATWEWSNNAALCQAHYLTQNYGGKIDPRKIDWDKVARAADWDDGMIGTTEGNFIRRGTLDGLITLNQSPTDVMSPMLSANRGFILESAGRTWVSSGEPRDPVATIHDGILSGGIEYRAAKPKRDLVNRLKVRFVAEDREYQTVDGPILARSDLLTDDGELLEGVLELPFTLDNRRAQYLQKAFLETARLGRRISCAVDVELLACAADELIGNAVTVSSDLFPQFNGTFFVESWGFTDQFGSINLSLVEYDKTIETDWDPASDQQSFTLAPLDTGS